MKMREAPRSAVALAAIVLLAACGGPAKGPPPCTGAACPDDGGQSDAGSPDAGHSDAGDPDAGSPDGGDSDAGSSDAGDSDAGAADAGPTSATLNFHVTGPSGAGMLNAFIDVDGTMFRTTDPSGNASFANVPTGAHHYTVKLTDFVDGTGDVDVKAPHTDVSVTMSSAYANVTAVFDAFDPDAIVSINGGRAQSGVAIRVNRTAPVQLTTTFFGATTTRNVPITGDTTFAEFGFELTDPANAVPDAAIAIGDQALTSDSSGKAATLLPAGTYSWRITHPAFLDTTGSSTATTAPDVQHVALNLPQSYTIAVHVVPADDQNTVKLGGQSVQTDAGGVAVLVVPNTRGARYDYSVERLGWETANDTTYVFGNTATSVYLTRLRWPVTITATVGGTPRAGVPLGAGASTDQNGQWQTTQESFSTVTYAVQGYGWKTQAFDVAVQNAAVQVTVEAEQKPENYDVLVMTGTPGGVGYPVRNVTLSAGGQTWVTDGAVMHLPLLVGQIPYTLSGPCWKDTTGVFDTAADVHGTTVYLNDRAEYPVALHAIDALTKAPVPQLAVRLAKHDAALDAVTDATGTALFTVTPDTIVDGNYELVQWTQYPAYQVSAGGAGYFQTNAFLAESCAPAERTLEVSPRVPWPVTLTLKDEAGGLVEGAAVTAGTASAVTDANGQAKLDLENGVYSWCATKAELTSTCFSVSVQDGPASAGGVARFVRHPTWIKVLGYGGFFVGGASVTIGDQSGFTGPTWPVLLFLRSGDQPWTASADGYTSGSGTLTVGTADYATLELAITAQPVPVGFDVSTPPGLPVAGATVALGGQSATTDATGHAQVSVVPESNMTWTVTAPQLVAQSHRIDLFVGMSPSVTVSMPVVLYPGTITVVDGAAAPLPLAQARWSGTAYLADANGAVALPLPHGQSAVVFSAPGFVDQTVTLDVSEDAAFTRTVMLSPQEYPVSAQVLDADGPLAAATLTIDGASVPLTGGAATFALAHGAHTFVVAAPDYVAQSGSLDIALDGVTKKWTLSKAEHAVTFHVTAGGAPLPNEPVTVDGRALRTDASGVATTSMFSGSYAWSAAPAEGYAGASGTAAVNAADASVNVALQPLPVYAVRFSATDGAAALQGATLTMAGQTATTDAGGLAQLSRWDGQYTWTARAPAHQTAQGSVTISGASQDVQVTLLPQAYTITLHVKDLTAPVANAEVTLDGTKLVTDEQGAVTLERVSGTYAYTVHRAEYVDQTGSVTVNGADAAADAAVTPTAAGLASMQKSAGQTAAAAANALVSRLGLPQDEAVLALQGGGYDADGAASALRSVFQQTAAQATAALDAAGYAPGGIAHAVYTVYGIAGQALNVALLAGLQPWQVAVGMRDAFGIPDSDRFLNDLGEAGATGAQLALAARDALGYDAARFGALRTWPSVGIPGTAVGLHDVFGVGGEAAAPLLSVYGREAQLTDALHQVFGLTDVATAAALRALNVQPHNLCPPLRSSYGDTLGAAVRALRDAGYDVATVRAELLAWRIASPADLAAAFHDAALPAADAVKGATSDLDWAAALSAAGYPQNDLLAGGVEPWAALRAGFDVKAVAAFMRATLALPAWDASQVLKGNYVYPRLAIDRALLAGGYTPEAIFARRDPVEIAIESKALGIEPAVAAAILKASASRGEPELFGFLLDGGYDAGVALRATLGEFGSAPATAGAALSWRYQSRAAEGIGLYIDTLSPSPAEAITALIAMSAYLNGGGVSTIRDRYHLGAEALANVVSEAGRSLEDVVFALDGAFGLATAAQVVPVLKSAGYSPIDVMNLRFGFWNMVTALRDAGYTVTEFAAWDRSHGGGASGAVNFLEQCGFALHDITTALRSSYGASAAAAVSYLQAPHAWTQQAIDDSIQEVYGVDAVAAVLADLHDRGVPPDRAAMTLFNTFGVTSLQVAATKLGAAGWSIAQVAQGLVQQRAVSLGAPFQTLVPALAGAFALSSLEAAGYTMTALRWTASSVAWALHDAGFTLAQTLGVLHGTFGLPEVAAAETLIATPWHYPVNWLPALQAEYGVDPLFAYAQDFKARGASAGDAGRYIAGMFLNSSADPGTLAGVLRDAGYTQAQVLDSLYSNADSLSYVHGGYATEAAVHARVLIDQFHADTTPALIAALRVHFNPGQVMEAIHDAKGLSWGLTLVEYSLAGYSAGQILEILPQDMPPRHDTSVAQAVRTVGMTASQAYLLLWYHGFTQAEAAGWLKTDGYQSFEIVDQLFSDGPDGAFRILLAIGYTPSEALRALVPGVQRHYPDLTPLGARATAIWAAFASGYSSVLGITADLVAAGVPAIDVIPVMKYANSSWTFHSLTYALSRVASLQDTARSLLAAQPHNHDLWLAMEDACADQGANLDGWLAGGMQDLVNALADLLDDPHPQFASVVAMATLRSAGFTARQAAKLLQDEGKDWKIAMIFMSISGYSSSESFSEVARINYGAMIGEVTSFLISLPMQDKYLKYVSRLRTIVTLIGAVSGGFQAQPAPLRRGAPPAPSR